LREQPFNQPEHSASVGTIYIHLQSPAHSTNKANK